MGKSGKIRVLIVDDSALVRKVMEEGLSKAPNLEVIGTAANPYEARDKIVKLNPDVVTLDVEMPRMDGVEFLRRLMPQFPIPVVMVSALTEVGKQITFDALAAGAVDVVAKPSRNVAGGLASMMTELCAKVSAAAGANVSMWKASALVKRPVKAVAALSESTDKVIAIGASTGGVVAAKVVLQSLPKTAPGVVIVQHLPETFTGAYAERLNRECPQDCVEATDGARILPGRAYVAPGGKHLRVVRSGGQYLLRCAAGPAVSGHTPSVDVLFESMASAVGPNGVGVILTGMGSDGAQGLLKMRNAGARTVAQDEASSVVFGMPKKALENGGAEAACSLRAIGSRVVGLLVPRKAA